MRGMANTEQGCNNVAEFASEIIVHGGGGKLNIRNLGKSANILFLSIIASICAGLLPPALRFKCEDNLRTVSFVSQSCLNGGGGHN